MDRVRPTPPCEFDRLFRRNVPHILEAIFFTLDYDSFAACREVCKSWSKLHATHPYRQRGDDMLEREFSLCQSSRDGNAEQVSNLLGNRVNINCERSLTGTSTEFGLRFALLGWILPQRLGNNIFYPHLNQSQHLAGEGNLLRGKYIISPPLWQNPTRKGKSQPEFHA